MRGRCCKAPTAVAPLLLLLGLACTAGQGGGQHVAVSNDWTGYWEVALDDMATMIMLYTEPTTASSPLCLVPAGGVLRGIEDPQANGSGMQRWDQDGSIWQRVLLPLVDHPEGGSAPHEDTSFGWALQGHADGTRYLRGVRRSPLHIARPEECFSNAAVGVDPNTGEHVILNANAAPISQYQPQALSQEYQPAPDSGWGSWVTATGGDGNGNDAGNDARNDGSWDGEDPYAGFGAFPWGPQGQGSGEDVPAAEGTECTPALYMLWWLLALRHMLERPAALEKLWLRCLAQMKPPATPLKPKHQSCGSPLADPTSRRLSFE